MRREKAILMEQKSVASPKVLYLLPYSESDSVHGGIIRAREIQQKLTANKVDVEVIKLLDLNYSAIETNFKHTLPREIAGDLDLLNRNFHLVERDLTTFDFIIFEQPWSWNEVKRLKEKNPHLKLIYSSQNIEWKLKEIIFRKYLGSSALEYAIKIRDLEIEIAQTVDFMLTVSSIDQSWYANYTKRIPLLLPNGTSLKATEHFELRTRKNNYGVVVGSAHPPNIEGCLKYLEDLELWMPAQRSIVVVGSLAQALERNWGGIRNRWQAVCVTLIPSASDEELKTWIYNSSVVLLPIAYGGGTNLKTAEALASNKPIVASQSAFRGYEDFSKLEGVHVAKNSLDFKIKTIASLTATGEKTIERDTTSLLWENTLNPIIQLLIGNANV